MFLKDTYSQRRLERLFHSQVLGPVPFEDLHEKIMVVIKKVGVINASFSISYEIRESDVESEGWMTYRIIFNGTRGFLFKKQVSALIQFESSCDFEHPVLVEAATEINDRRREVVTTCRTYIGQGRGMRLGADQSAY